MKIKINAVQKLPGGNVAISGHIVDAEWKPIAGSFVSITTKTTDASAAEIQAIYPDFIHELTLAPTLVVAN